MKIPKYWAKAESEGRDRDGKELALSCWRWSDVSVDDARRKAEERVRELMHKAEGGEELQQYPYGVRPMKEEIVETIAAGKNKEAAVITRNGYGALVLNAANAMFIDIDFGTTTLKEQLAGFFKGLLGGKNTTQEGKVLAQVRQWADLHTDLDLRIYRTLAGLRCLVTNQTFDPADTATLGLMEELDCDKLYVRLCKQQECFRARLTPKPWRCNTYKPPVSYPYETGRDREIFEKWKSDYERAISSYSVCRLVEQIGSDRFHPEIDPIVALHDKYCLIDEGLPLA